MAYWQGVAKCARHHLFCLDLKLKNLTDLRTNQETKYIMTTKTTKTKYVSAITEKGNSSYSYKSQEKAEENAKRLDDNGCTNCIQCLDCVDCKNCAYCRDCIQCSYCVACSNCDFCISCSGIVNNTDITRARFPKNSKTKVTKQLLGLTYDVFFTETHIKIGCQLNTIEKWKNFSAKDALQFGPEAVIFFNKHRDTILAIATSEY